MSRLSTAGREMGQASCETRAEEKLQALEAEFSSLGGLGSLDMPLYALENALLGRLPDYSDTFRSSRRKLRLVCEQMKRLQFAKPVDSEQIMAGETLDRAQTAARSAAFYEPYTEICSQGGVKPPSFQDFLLYGVCPVTEAETRRRQSLRLGCHLSINSRHGELLYMTTLSEASCQTLREAECFDDSLLLYNRRGGEFYGMLVNPENRLAVYRLPEGRVLTLRDLLVKDLLAAAATVLSVRAPSRTGCRPDGRQAFGAADLKPNQFNLNHSKFFE